MALICATCRSDNTQVLADRYECHDCGAKTFFTGLPAPDGLVWTTPVPEKTAETAGVTATAAAPPKKAKGGR